MRAIRRILVAIKDPKAKSAPAADKAAQLARAMGAQIELFHGIATPVYVEALSGANADLVELERKRREVCTKQLEAIATRIRKHGVDVSTHVQWDFPIYEAILRRARRIKADLIVAERHQGKHLIPGLLQLTDWELLRQSPIPVLLVKNARPYKNPVVLAAVDPTHAFSKPTRLDDEILEAGNAIKGALRGTLHALHAYVPIPVGIPPSEYLKPDFATRLDAQAQGAVKGSFARVAEAAGVQRARRHLVGENPVDAIPNTAKKTGAAIVVMGAISRSGLKRFFIGNTAEEVLDRLTCDILVVKPPRFGSGVQKATRGVRLLAAQPMVA